MDFLQSINDKHDILTKLGDSAAKVSKAFHEQGNSDSPMPQLDAIAKGYESSAFMLQKISNLELLKLFQGQPLSAALITRLLSINPGDFVHGTLGREVNVLGSLSKLCLEEETMDLQRHGEQIANAGKGVQSLLLSLAAGLFENLLVQTAKEEPEIREFFQDSGLQDLTDYIVVTNPRHVGAGGYADVFETELLRPPSQQPKKVAVKVLRMYQVYVDAEDGMKIARMRRRLRREIEIWQTLSHINIVPLLGLTHQFNKSPLPSMVCHWMESGTLSSHLKKSLTLRSRYKLVQDVIDGLSYLHSRDVVHGDLTSGNVLISEGIASLCDFGLSRVIGTLPAYFSTNNFGTTRWAAPELFCFDENLSPAPITKKCDVYSYGCIVHEVISTYLPYYDINVEIAITLEKMNRTTPNRPPSPLLTNDVWDFIRLCWRDDPMWRPDVGQVVAKLKELIGQYSQEELAQIWPAEVDALEVEAGLEHD